MTIDDSIMDTPPLKSSPFAPFWPAIRRDLEMLGSDVLKLSETALECGQEKVVSEAMELKSTVNNLIGRVEDRSKSLVDDVQTYVVTRPVTSIAVSFAAGLIIANLLSPRR